MKNSSTFEQSNNHSTTETVIERGDPRVNLLIKILFEKKILTLEEKNLLLSLE